VERYEMEHKRGLVSKTSTLASGSHRVLACSQKLDPLDPLHRHGPLLEPINPPLCVGSGCIETKCLVCMRSKITHAPVGTSVRHALLNLEPRCRRVYLLHQLHTGGIRTAWQRSSRGGNSPRGAGHGPAAASENGARRPPPRTTWKADEAWKDSIQQTACFALTLAPRTAQWSVVVSPSGRANLARASTDGAQGEDAQHARKKNLVGAVSSDHPERRSLKHMHPTAAPQCRLIPVVTHRPRGPSADPATLRSGRGICVSAFRVVVAVERRACGHIGARRPAAACLTTK